MSASSLGVIYVAYGHEYFVMAAHSAKTLREHNKGFHVTLITNLPVRDAAFGEQPLFDRIIVTSAAAGENRYKKVRVIDYATKDDNLFLDCDTEIWGSLEKFRVLLEHFDVAIRQFPYDTEYVFDISDRYDTRHLAIPEWNSGVIFFRNNQQAISLFRLWEDKFKDMGVRRDQPSFAYAVINCRNCRIFPLSPGWNATNRIGTDTWFLKAYHDQVRIFHYRRAEAEPYVARRLAETLSKLRITWNAKASRHNKEIAILALSYKMYSNPLFRIPGARKILQAFYSRLARAHGAEEVRMGRKSDVKGSRARRLREDT